MANTGGVEAPNMSELRLVDLEDVDARDLASRGLREGERLADADLEERDLEGIALSECEWLDVALSGADLTRSRLAETRLTRVSGTVVRAPRSTWRDVHIEDSRIGAAEFFESEWRSVRFSGCKLGYVNLRSARLSDVEFRNCTIDEIDLEGATVLRAAFPDSRLRTLGVGHAFLEHVDLRGLELSVINGVGSLAGAVVSETQLLELAPLLAGHLGIVVA